MANEEENATTTVSTEKGDAEDGKGGGSSGGEESHHDESDGMKDDEDGDGEDEKSDKDGKAKKGESTTTDWPLRGIVEPHENDVLYGRGGGTNHHPGNKRYRKMVEDRKLDYVNSKRLDKPLVALGIIREWRAQDPPGRFLKPDNNGLWNDVGDKKAREKTSQALREKAPLIRKQQEEEKMGHDETETDEKPPATKTTRFAEGTNTDAKPKDDLRKAVLARDHSLGREYIKAGEAVSLEGFSWQDPFQSSDSINTDSRDSVTMREGSTYSLSGPVVPGAPIPEVPGPYSGPPPPALSPRAPSDYRISSQGSMGAPVPPGPPPPPDYYGRVASGEDPRIRYSSTGRHGSWGRHDSWGKQAPPAYTGYPAPQRSGSWTYEPARENSLSLNPLAGASISQPAPRTAFESTRSGSGFWEDPGTRHSATAHHYSPSRPLYGQGHRSRHSSGSSPYQYHQPPQGDYNPSSITPPLPSRDYGHTNGAPPMPKSDHGGSSSPRYSVDPAIARTWSNQSEEEIQRTYDKRLTYGQGRRNEYRVSEDDDPSSVVDLPRPTMVKRATSHQNETVETRPDLKGPSVKRAALNRDNSTAANRLKETYLPEFYGEGRLFNPEQEMNILSTNLEQSTLEADRSRPRPNPLKNEERKPTFDINALDLDLMIKPISMKDTGRSSTIDALALALDDDPLIQAEAKAMESASTLEDAVADLRGGGLAKPAGITNADRLTTVDVLDMVNEPLYEDDGDVF